MTSTNADVLVNEDEGGGEGLGSCMYSVELWSV